MSLSSPLPLDTLVQCLCRQRTLSHFERRSLTPGSSDSPSRFFSQFRLSSPPRFLEILLLCIHSCPKGSLTPPGRKIYNSAPFVSFALPGIPLIPLLPRLRPPFFCPDSVFTDLPTLDVALKFNNLGWSFKMGTYGLCPPAP